LKALRDESTDAALDVRCIDILAIAKKTTLRPGAGNVATTFERSETLQIARHVDVRRTRPTTTGNAMILTRIRAHHGHVAAIFTMTLASRFRCRYAIVGRWIRHLASRNRRLIAFRVAAIHAIEGRGIALRKALRAAIPRAHRRGRNRTATFATSNEIERFALRSATPFDFDCATSAIFVEIEIAAFGRRFEGKCCGRDQHQAGNCKERKSEFAEVRHRFFLTNGVTPEIPTIVIHERTSARYAHRPAMDEVRAKNFTREVSRNLLRSGT
jgi:hypothetical protein